VSCERVAKDTCPRSTYRAHRVWRYSPKPAVAPAHMITKMPRKMPIFESAEGIASKPAPRTASGQKRVLPYRICIVLVLARLITLDIHDAWPWNPASFLPRPRLFQSAHVPAMTCPYILTVSRAATQCSRTWDLPLSAPARWRSTWPSPRLSMRYRCYCAIMREVAQCFTARFAW
jgi:hypothetical protein